MAHSSRTCIVTLTLLGSLLATRAAAAADAPEETAPPTKPVEADKPPASPDERPDGVRFRGGFLFEGGPVIVPGSSMSGGSASLAIPTLHVGAQINHYFGVYYENHPLFMLLAEGSSSGGSVAVGFADLNTFIASVTLLHTIELGGGAGFDFYALAGCDASSDGAGCGAGTVVLPGLHAKAAAHLGGWGGEDSHRNAFSIQVAFHASIDPSGGAILLPLAGLGGEWF